MSIEATIEVGHTYAPDRLTRLVPLNRECDSFYSESCDRWFYDTPEAAQVRAVAEALGGTSMLRVALVDDVAVRHRQLRGDPANSWIYQNAIGFAVEGVRLGTGASSVRLESELESQGRALIDEITSCDLPEGYRLSNDGRKVITGSSRNRFAVPLRGFQGVDDPMYPSCQVLDLAWLKERLEVAPKAVTVLPQEYEAQQRGLTILAGIVGIEPSAHQTVFI